MADITVTPAEVIPQNGSDVKWGTAGEDIDAGEFIYFDAADNGKAKLADANGTGAAHTVQALAVTTSADDQPLGYVLPGAEVQMDTSAFATAGLPVFLSANPGKCSVTAADYTTGWYYNHLGVVKAGGKILQFGALSADTAK